MTNPSPGLPTRRNRSRGSSRDAWFNPLVGVKYTWRGRSVETGYDCYGIVVAAHAMRGSKIPVYDDCQPEIHDSEEISLIITDQMPSWIKIAAEAARELDVVTFDGGDGVGVVVDPSDGTGLRILTSNAEVGRSLCLPFWSLKWSHRITGVFRFPGPSA